MIRSRHEPASNRRVWGGPPLRAVPLPRRSARCAPDNHTPIRVTKTLGSLLNHRCVASRRGTKEDDGAETFWGAKPKHLKGTLVQERAKPGNYRGSYSARVTLLIQAG